jgi:hypothetical protein
VLGLCVLMFAGHDCHVKCRVKKARANVQAEKAHRLGADREHLHKSIETPVSSAQTRREIESKRHGTGLHMTKGFPVRYGRFIVLVVAAFAGGMVGGFLSRPVLSPGTAEAQKSTGVNAEEFLLLDQAGKARAGLGLDANGEVGLVLTSKDGARTLTLSPDEHTAIKLVERGGRILWAAP